MKAHPALAIIEYKSVPAGIYAADAILKKSPISLIRSGTIGEGKYLVLFAGTTASVEEAYQEGLFQGGLQVLDDIFLPDIHEELYAAIFEKKAKVGEAPVFILETPSVAICVGAVEQALKGVPVKLLEFRMGDPRMAGRGLAILQGDLHDLEAAQEITLSVIEAKGLPSQHRILSFPTPFILEQIAASTRFDQSKPLALAGETTED